MWPRRTTYGVERPSTAVTAVLAGLGLWAGNVGCQWALAFDAWMRPAGSIYAAGALPDGLEPLAFVSSALAAAPLGISAAPAPIAAGALAALIAATAYRDSVGRRSRRIAPHEQTGKNGLAAPEDYAPLAHDKATDAWPVPAWCAEAADDNIVLSQNARVAYADAPDAAKVKGLPKNRHVFVMAGSGAGKTFNFLTTNAMQCNSSMVFSDPKGELFRRLARFLCSQGYVVRVVDLHTELSILLSDGFDPFAYCKDMTAIAATVDVLIANTSSPESSGAQNQKFFEDMERAGYKAIFGLMKFWFADNGRPEDFTMPAILDYLPLLANDDGAAPKLDLVFFGTREKDGFDGYMQYLIDNVLPRYGGDEARMRAEAPEYEPITHYRTVRSAFGSPEEMAGVLSSMNNRMQPFANPALRKLFSKGDELEIDQLGRRKQALFLCIDDTGGPYDFVASLIVSTLFKVLTRQADESASGHLDVPVTCYLDELANIGRLPRLGMGFNTFRSRWLNLVAITQYSDQLKVTYKDEARSILAAAMIEVYLGAGDWETCELMSKRIGERTVRYEERSRTRSSTGGSTTVAERWVKVPIVSPQELNTIGLDADQCLVKTSSHQWLLDVKPDPRSHPRWDELVRAGPAMLADWARERDAERAAASRRRAREKARGRVDGAGGRVWSLSADDPNLIVVRADAR